jgi:hypothetical protein
MSAFMQRDVRQALAGDGQHLRVEVEPFDLVSRQVHEMRAGAAGHVEERPRARPLVLDQPVELRGLARVVADRRVDRVVDARGALNTRRILSAAKSRTRFGGNARRRKRWPQ